jgi:hypothetical protein
MKYLIALVVAVSLSFGVAILPSFADSGVSVTLTTTVTGNGGGGGNPFDSGGSYPNSMPNWASVFPQMNQPQSSSPSYTPVVQQSVPIPPVILEPQSTYVPPVTPIQTPTENKDTLVYIFIGLGAILIGLIIYWLLPEQRVR